MRKDLFHTLFSRMLTTYLAVIFCLLLLMGVTVSSMYKNQYIREEQLLLRDEAERVNTILAEKYIDPNKRATARDELKVIARRYDAMIQVIDVQGSIETIYNDSVSEETWGTLGESQKQYLEETPPRISMPGLDIFPEELSILRTGGKKPFSLGGNSRILMTEQGAFLFDLFTDVMDISTLTLARAFVNSNGEHQGIILMHIDMRLIHASIKQVYLDVLLVSLLAVLVAVLVTYYLTTYITKPIIEMNQIVRKYSKGSFELRLNDDGTDEVAQLAKSFNIMANELQALETTRRSLVANVSHELRSPLTSISGFLEAIQDGTIPPERHAQYIDLVIRETRRMTNMVSSLLDLARMESGDHPMKLTQFDMNELARRTIITFEARINSKRLDVTLTLMEPNCYVEADADQMAQVLRNLIDNAIKFSPEGGKLRIQTALRDRKTAMVSVQDFGAGIPKEDLAHVFERFFKAEKAHTPSAQAGTGLGLSIAQVIIDRHGQDIWVESTPEAGTTFTFTAKYIPEPKHIQERRRLDGKSAAKSKGDTAQEVGGE